MSFERDEKLLQEYSEWVLMQKQRDTSPSTFLLDRGKEEAFEKLIKAIDFIEGATGDDGRMEPLNTAQVEKLYEILQGDDA